MNRQPLVSVVMPTYKRSNMITRAIDSVLNQTYKNIQIVVVDDNVANSEWRVLTKSRLKKYQGDLRVKYVCHEDNRNGSVARNTGIACSDGEIITFLDDDDEYLPTKVEEQVTYLMSHPEFRAVYCGWNRGTDIVPKGEGNLSFGVLSGQQIIITNALMLWKNDILSAGGYDPLLKRHQEAALILNFFQHGGLIGRIDKILVKFDMSDRSNAVDAYQNEKIIRYLLKKYDDVLDQNEFLMKGAKKKIIAIRYKGVLYNYILSKHYFSALRFFFEASFRFPLSFIPCVVCDVIRRKKKW